MHRSAARMHIHLTYTHVCRRRNTHIHIHIHTQISEASAYMLACTSACMLVAFKLSAPTFVCMLACMLVAFMLLAVLNSARRRCALLCFQDDTCPHVLPCLMRIVLACHRPCLMRIVSSVHPCPCILPSMLARNSVKMIIDCVFVSCARVNLVA